MEGNLQNRLAAAREARRRVSGPPPPPLVADDAPVEAVETGPLDGAATRQPVAVALVSSSGEDEAAPAVFDLRTLRSLRQRARQALVDDEPAATPKPLLTTEPLRDRCPKCSGTVRIDVFDLVAGVAHLTCVDCGHLYTARSPWA